MRNLLWLDCGGALLVGSAMLILSGWLLPLYRMPAVLYYGVAGANLVYGSFSLSLARRTRRPVRAVQALALANMTWCVLCMAAAVLCFGQISVLGVGHLVLEGGYVLWLGRAEWRFRHLLAAEGDGVP